MTIMLSTFCAAIVIVSVMGGILPLATVLNHTRLQVYLSFSAGTMLGTAFFHMLPEAVRVGSAETLGWTAVGLLGVFFLERFFSFHHHEEREPPAPALSASAPVARQAIVPGEHHHEEGARNHSAETNALSWASAALGLIVHSLVGGIAPASAVEADYRVGKGAGGAGLGVFIATLVHKPADLTITSLMVRSGVPRALAQPGEPGFRAHDPGRRRPVLDRNRGNRTGLRRRLDRDRSGLLGGHIPLHRAQRPVARTSISFPRPPQALHCPSGWIPLDGGHFRSFWALARRHKC